MALRLKSVLSDLAEQGVRRDDLTAEDIEALVYACARADNPYSDLNAELCERPVKVCRGVYLWPVTAGAQVWLTEFAEAWWPNGSAMRRWAQLYALRNARDPEAFARLDTKAKARRAVLACALRMAAHRAEIAVAVNRCYGVRYHDAEDPFKAERPDNEQREGFARLVADLEVGTGIPAKDWLWGHSLASTAKAYRRMRALACAFGGGKASAEMQFELDDALRNLANVKAQIVRRAAAAKRGGADGGADGKGGAE